MAARSIARAESNEAVPSSGTRSNVEASAIAAHRSASAVCPSIMASQHHEGGILLDRRAAKHREPALQDRHLARLVRLQGQL